MAQVQGRRGTESSRLGDVEPVFHYEAAVQYVLTAASLSLLLEKVSFVVKFLGIRTRFLGSDPWVLAPRSVSDNASKQRLFGHRICDLCVGELRSYDFRHRLLCNTCMVAGDGLDEETYRENMLSVAEEREEKRTALMDEGTQTRKGIYDELIAGCGGIEAIIAHRQDRSIREEPEAEEGDDDPDYIADDGDEDTDEAEIATKARSKRVSKLHKQEEQEYEEEEQEYEDEGADEEAAEEEEGTDDEYGGLE
jgi:hypothetical protein